MLYAGTSASACSARPGVAKAGSSVISGRADRLAAAGRQTHQRQTHQRQGSWLRHVVAGRQITYLDTGQFAVIEADERHAAAGEFPLAATLGIVSKEVHQIGRVGAPIGVEVHHGGQQIKLKNAVQIGRDTVSPVVGQRNAVVLTEREGRRAIADRVHLQFVTGLNIKRIVTGTVGYAQNALP